MNSPNSAFDPFRARDSFDTGNGRAAMYRLSKLEDAGLGSISRLPYSIRILLEAVLRKCDDYVVTQDDVRKLASWNAAQPAKEEIPFMPARVVLQDFTGVPAVVDLAAMRSAMRRLGGSPSRINPLIPVDLVIDHSVQVDRFGSNTALAENVALEFERNRERYEFLRWGQQAFNNFRVVPPNVGIVHQVNLEYLARVVFVDDADGTPVAFPDSLVGTDSHTTMINGLGVLGWGVGGIEAEAAMLGQPLYMLLPEVVGFELTGQLQPGTTATDLVLTVTQILRKEGVVNKFVEFFGEGVSRMSLADRATIANMAPEYGATMGFFPIDGETLTYMRRTGRSKESVDLVERYSKEQGLFRTDSSPSPEYTKRLSLDLGSVEPSLAGPKRPQDRVSLANMKSGFHSSLSAPLAERGFGLGGADLERVGKYSDPTKNASADLQNGAVVIAAITSCTNTSNPSVMVAAGLLARNAVARGLKVPAYVKTSLAPGSRVVTEYLAASKLDEPLRALGFHTLLAMAARLASATAVRCRSRTSRRSMSGDLVAGGWCWSGNRNFEGRVNPVKANYLASPPLVVAYALAGTVDLDLVNELIGTDESASRSTSVNWPTDDEIRRTANDCIQPEMSFVTQYQQAWMTNDAWNAIPLGRGPVFIQGRKHARPAPLFLAGVTPEAKDVAPIQSARVLALLGDSVTTDHISPAGSIAKTSPAGTFVQGAGVTPADFNSYGARRGNDRVMVRHVRQHLHPHPSAGARCRGRLH
ncbi:MAG: aconitate hydratase AcnA [Pirellulaceae bacterium]